MLDRSKEFIELSKSSSSRSSSIWPFSPSTPEVDLELGTHDTSFMDKMELISSALDTVSKLTKETEALHKSALLSADAQSLADISGKIEIKIKATSINIESSRKNLKLIDEQLKSNPQNTPEYRTQQARHQNMCRRFLKVVSTFEDMQSTYRNKYKRQLERQYLLMKPEATPEELEQLGHSSQTSLMLTEQVFKMDTLSAKKALTDMQERHDEILMIEKSMTEIQKMFSDIAMLVQQQGETIRTIDDLVSQTEINLESAAKVLKDRAILERRRQIRRITLYTFGCSILIILLLIIVNELFFN